MVGPVRKAGLMREDVRRMPRSCAVEVAMTVLGGKWKMLILKKLLPGPRRFGELGRLLPGITQRMLTRQLRELESDGLVRRTVCREVPLKVEYALTDTGRSLEHIMAELDRWGVWYRDLRSADGPDDGAGRFG